MELKDMLYKDETVLWNGQPNIKSFVLQKITSGLGIALFFLLFDSVFIFAMVSSRDQFSKFEIIPIVIFFALHLLPVWIWVSHLFTAKASWKNTEYMVTDKRIMLKSGIIGNDITSLFYVDIKNVYVNVGFIDKVMGTGDLIIQQGLDLGTIHRNNNNSNQMKNVIRDIDNPYTVYNQIQKIINDIQTDMLYPNGTRPDSNPGYQTKYTAQ